MEEQHRSTGQWDAAGRRTPTVLGCPLTRCPLQSCDLTCDTVSQACEAASRCSRVRLMANRLQAQLDESSASCRSSSASATCQVRTEHRLSQTSIDQVTTRVHTCPHAEGRPHSPTVWTPSFTSEAYVIMASGKVMGFYQSAP